jgi:MFS family permease
VTRTTGALFSAARWRLFAPALVIMWIVGMVDKVGVGVIATNDAFLRDMNLSGRPATIGLLTTIMLIFYGLAMPLWGSMTDRFGPRRCAVVGLVFWALSTLLAGLANGVVMLLVARALLGASEGFLWPVSNALTARWFPLSERGRAKSVWINGINFGFAISGFLVIGAIGALGWRGVFFLLTAIALVICVPAALLFIRDDPARDRRVSEAELTFIRSNSLLTAEGEAGPKELLSKAYWVAVLVWVVNNIGVFGLASWFPTYLRSKEHLDGTTTSLFIALAFILCIVVGPLVGWATDRTGHKAIWVFFGFGLAILFLLLTRALPSAGYQLIGVIGAIVGVEGFTTLAGQGVLHSIAPTQRMGRANGVMSGAGNFIGAFGATIMGALIGVGGFNAAFTFLIVVFGVGCLASWLLHRWRY